MNCSICVGPDLLHVKTFLDIINFSGLTLRGFRLGPLKKVCFPEGRANVIYPKFASFLMFDTAWAVKFTAL